MAQETKIVVHDVNVNHATGYVTYHVKAHTVDGSAEWDGPIRQYGVDAQMLRDRFHGSLDEFEAWIVKEHKSLGGANPEFVAGLLSRSGKILG